MTDHAQTCRVRDSCVQLEFKISSSHWKQSNCVQFTSVLECISLSLRVGH